MPFLPALLPILGPLIGIGTTAFGAIESGRQSEEASNAAYQQQLAAAKQQQTQAQQQQQQQQAQLAQLARVGSPDVQNQTGGSLTPGPFAAQDSSIIGAPGQQADVLKALSNISPGSSAPPPPADISGGTGNGGSTVPQTQPGLTDMAFQYGQAA